MIQRFTAYRRDIEARVTHTEKQRNSNNEPQFEGVIWSDGTVTLRWMTACRSTSVWQSMEDCLAVHGHPEYGTHIVWHDGDEHPVWRRQIDNWYSGAPESDT